MAECGADLRNGLRVRVLLTGDRLRNPAKSQATSKGGG